MRVLLAAVLLLLTGAACANAGPARDAAGQPRLVLRAVDPLTVVGVGFRSREKVRVLVSSPAPTTRTVVASRRGRFTVRLRVAVDRCTAVVVQARGSKGSRAQISLDAPDCAPVDEP